MGQGGRSCSHAQGIADRQLWGQEGIFPRGRLALLGILATNQDQTIISTEESAKVLSSCKHNHKPKTFMLMKHI